MKYERALVLVVIGCLLFLIGEIVVVGKISKSSAFKATSLRNRAQVQKSVKKPSHVLIRQSFKVPPALKTKLSICNAKLAAIENTFKEIRSAKVLKESHVNTLKEKPYYLCIESERSL